MTALIGLASRIKTAKLHLVTDLTSSPDELNGLLLAALRGGVDVVQLRDAHATDEQLRAALKQAHSLTRQVGGLVVLAGRSGLAATAGVDLVHLGAADDELAAAREAVGPYGLVGRSVHEAASLARTDADYLFVGPVLAGGIDGLALVREAARVLPVDRPDATPWIAVGGITLQNLDEVVAAGAMRVAVTSAITRASDPQAAAAALRERLQQAWDAHPGMDEYLLRAVGGGGASFRTTSFSAGTVGSAGDEQA